MCCAFQSVCTAADNSENELLLQRAEQLLSSHKDNEALHLYEKVLALSADSYEALCKASLLHCRIGDRYSDETSKLQHFEKAKNYARRAYSINSTDAESNFVMAMSMYAYAMVAGPKERLSSIHDAKPFIDAALACNSHHDGAWYLLGRWYYKMANLNFAEKIAAKVFFDGLCEEATNQHAVEALNNAIAYNPTYIRYYYDLACIYQDMNETQSCITTLEKALTVNLDTKNELELSRRCKIMLKEHLNN
ncbi:tetratricopeptide repeat protein [Pontibacter silvestris]|uniref:Tetratricopeptide repeat protein n=2 Tax=Pontibacter silvestris TaxID=2305183 RepID=A0ABW4X0T7_9BACT